MNTLPRGQLALSEVTWRACSLFEILQFFIQHVGHVLNEVNLENAGDACYSSREFWNRCYDEALIGGVDEGLLRGFEAHVEKCVQALDLALQVEHDLKIAEYREAIQERGELARVLRTEGIDAAAWKVKALLVA